VRYATSESSMLPTEGSNPAGIFTATWHDTSGTSTHYFSSTTFWLAERPPDSSR
jgi:hypothetical protein